MHEPSSSVLVQTRGAKFAKKISLRPLKLCVLIRAALQSARARYRQAIPTFTRSPTGVRTKLRSIRSAMRRTIGPLPVHSHAIQRCGSVLTTPITGARLTALNRNFPRRQNYGPSAVTARCVRSAPTNQPRVTAVTRQPAPHRRLARVHHRLDQHHPSVSRPGRFASSAPASSCIRWPMPWPTNSRTTLKPNASTCF